MFQFHGFLPVTTAEDFEDRIAVLNNPAPLLSGNKALKITF